MEQLHHHFFSLIQSQSFIQLIIQVFAFNQSQAFTYMNKDCFSIIEWNYYNFEDLNTNFSNRLFLKSKLCLLIV